VTGSQLKSGQALFAGPTLSIVLSIALLWATPGPVVAARAAATGPTTTKVARLGPGFELAFHDNQVVMSRQGRYVAFESNAPLVAGDTNGGTDVYLRDRQTGGIHRVSVAADGAQANGPSFTSDISADGRFVAFDTRATNVLPGGNNG
jgi:hypothetical protein